jgi:hypothetical protein
MRHVMSNPTGMRLHLFCSLGALTQPGCRDNRMVLDDKADADRPRRGRECQWNLTLNPKYTAELPLLP